MLPLPFVKVKLLPAIEAVVNKEPVATLSPLPGKVNDEENIDVAPSLSSKDDVSINNLFEPLI